MDDNGSAVDFANFTDIPTSAQAQCLAQGYQRAIVGVSYGDRAALQMQVCAKAGLEVNSYPWVEFRDTWMVAIDTAVANCRAAGPDFHEQWFDCEEDVGSMTQEQVRQRIRDAIARMLLGDPHLNVNLYTRRQWWLDFTGDWDFVSEYPGARLMEANYVHSDTQKCKGIDQERPQALKLEFVPFGGFTQRAMLQWHGSTQICELNVDVSIIEEELGMTPAEKKDYEELKQTVLELAEKLNGTLDLAVRNQQRIDVIEGKK